MNLSKVNKIKYSDNYNAILLYWEEIETGKTIVSDKVKRTYKHLIKQMEITNSRWIFDSSKANHAMEFIENYCKLSKVKRGRSNKFILELWQKAMLSAMFGFVDRDTGLRQYQEVIFMVARKNGKSALASAVGLYMQMADGENSPEIVSVATKKDQAKLIWLEAKRMVKKSPELLKRIKPLVGELSSEDFNEGTFKPLSSESDSLDGLNVSNSLIDELHAIKDKNLYDVIIDSMSTRDQPLSLITTTAGTVREGIFDIKYQEACNIVSGYDDDTENAYKDERTLCLIYELDSRKEWIDPKNWTKANPSLGTIKDFDKLERKVNKAKANPIHVKNLLCKDFNVIETSTDAWLTFEQLNNIATFDIEELKPDYAIGGVDLSKVSDLTCATLLFRKSEEDETIYCKQMYWMPETALERKIGEDGVPYDLWLEQDFLRTCEGNEVSFKDVTQWFLEMRDDLDIMIPWVGYDGWSANYWVEDMQNYFGKDAMDKVIFGKFTLSLPMQKLQKELERKTLNYGNNPILKWCLSNTGVEVDKNENISPVKMNAAKRIDGVASLLCAYTTYQRKQNEYINML